MLADEFYKISNSVIGETQYRFSLLLNPDHPIYQAHFPGSPVTPGVCLLQIGQELLGFQFQSSIRLVQAKNIKYLKVLDPLQNPEITYVIDVKNDGELLQADITITDGSSVFTKISASYKVG